MGVVLLGVCVWEANVSVRLFFMHAKKSPFLTSPPLFTTQYRGPHLHPGHGPGLLQSLLGRPYQQ